MEQQNYDSVKFDAVWQRVTADSGDKSAQLAQGETYYAAEQIHRPVYVPPPAEKPGMMTNEAARLSKFMDDTALCACYCKNIAMKCNGRAGKTLSCIAEEERKNLKKLRAKYFILTGGAYCPVEECPRVCTVSEGLRKVYALTSGCADGYMKAADTAGAELAHTYNELACNELRHAESVSCLIESMMC